MTSKTPEPRRGYKAVIYAENQKEYVPLPANTDGREVETKWKLSWRERLYVLFGGSFYLTFLTFGKKLQPVRCSIIREHEWDAVTAEAAEAHKEALKRVGIEKSTPDYDDFEY
jgi:hypothetical protein